MSPVVAPIARDELWLKLRLGERVTLVEALGPAFYADAHLPGALNLPSDVATRLAPEILPDQDATIVVYGSDSCTQSVTTAERLVELGYTNVRIYPGGKQDWVEAGLPVDRGP